MSKQLIFIFTAIVSISILNTAGAVLINPGFERGELSPWEQTWSGGVVTEDWNVIDTDAYSGLYSATAVGDSMIEQTFPPIPTENIIEISFWRKISIIRNYAGLLTYTDGGRQFNVPTISTEWEFYDITSNLETGRELTGIGFYGHDERRTFIDDVTITLIPEPGTFFLLGLGSLALLRRPRSSK